MLIGYPYAWRCRDDWVVVRGEVLRRHLASQSREGLREEVELEEKWPRAREQESGDEGPEEGE